MRIICFLLLFPFNSIAQDALLEAMFKDWSTEQTEDENNYSDFPNNSEPEVYHWELGTPDNVPEIEIIYTDDNPCQL
jgi:hypothetical protein